MKPLVYYVDDCPNDIALVTLAVKGDERFNLLGFTSIKEMRVRIEEHLPDIIMLDLNLGKDLTGSLESIKIRQTLPDVQLVIYSNFDKFRIEKLIPSEELQSNKTVIWQKTDIDITELGDRLMGLLNFY